MEQKVKLTYAEIIKKLTDADIRTDHFHHEGFDDKQAAVMEQLGPYKKVDSVGGYTGGGEYVERVFLFEEHDVYLCITGYYDSNNGTDIDPDFNEVFPRRTIVVVYETLEQRGDKTDEV